MAYQTITQADEDEIHADAVFHREREVFVYDLNIANYTDLLETLPKGDAPMDADPVTKGEYAFAAELRQLIVTEQIQRNRAAHALDMASLRLSADPVRRAEALDAARRRHDASKAAALNVTR